MEKHPQLSMKILIESIVEIINEILVENSGQADKEGN